MEIWIQDKRVIITFSQNNIQIKDSYLITNDKHKEYIIDTMMSSEKFNEQKYTRSKKSYLREWQAPNVLYKWGIQKQRTKDVDFSEHEPLFKRVCYFLLSIISKNI